MYSDASEVTVIAENIVDAAKLATKYESDGLRVTIIHELKGNVLQEGGAE